MVARRVGGFGRDGSGRVCGHQRVMGADECRPAVAPGIRWCVKGVGGTHVVVLSWVRAEIAINGPVRASERFSVRIPLWGAGFGEAGHAGDVTRGAAGLDAPGERFGAACGAWDVVAGVGVGAANGVRGSGHAMSSRCCVVVHAGHRVAGSTGVPSEPRTQPWPAQR